MNGYEGRQRKPKLLQICAVDYHVYHFLRPLAHALAEDYEVHFATAPGPYVEKIRGEGFGYHCVPIARSYDLLAHVRAGYELLRLMNRENYDVVHAHTPIASLLGRFAARLAAVPIVLYTAHGFYFHDRMSRAARSMFISLERLGGLFTDFTFTVSAEDRETAVRLELCDPRRVMHVGNGIDLERFDGDQLVENRQSYREALDIGPERPVACITGRRVREKGYYELVDAFERVVQRVPDALLLVVGGAVQNEYDDVSEDIERIVRERSMGQSVRFLPFRTDIEAVLAASDVFVLPSHREGMPVSIIEAMACGLPVVATNIRGSREAVEHGMTGELVEVGDVDSLAAAMIRLLSSPERRRAWGARAQVVARKRFDQRAVLRMQLDVLKRLQAERGFAAG
jgi:glycosyltransferase involved in cell wall biosynthesis